MPATKTAAPKKKSTQSLKGAAKAVGGEEFLFESTTREWSGLAWGPVKGIPILALHGWLDNAASFSALGPLLAKAGFRVFAVDLPGHVDTTGNDPGRAFHLVDAVTAVAELVDALGVPKIRILGHSLGAGVAALYTGSFGDRVEKLALIEGFGPFSATEAESPERLRSHVLAMQELLGKVLPVYKEEDVPGLAERRAAVAGHSIEAAWTLLSRGLGPADPEEGPKSGLVWQTDPQLRLPSPWRMTEGQVISFLNAIRCPALFIQGADGMKFPQEIAIPRLAAVPHLERETLPGGHHLHLDNPGPVAERLIRFF